MGWLKQVESISAWCDKRDQSPRFDHAPPACYHPIPFHSNHAHSAVDSMCQGSLLFLSLWKSFHGLAKDNWCQSQRCLVAANKSPRSGTGLVASRHPIQCRSYHAQAVGLIHQCLWPFLSP